MATGENVVAPAPEAAEAPAFVEAPPAQEKGKAGEGDAKVFKNAKGLKLFWRQWVPEGGEAAAKGIVVLLHGVAEHSGRYDEIGTHLARELGVAVYALDHHGHGKSEGARTHSKRFDDYVADAKQFADMVRARHTEAIKMFVLGHSMGGLMTIATCHAYPKLFAGAVICSPPLKIKLSPCEVVLVRMAAACTPKAAATNVDVTVLCRDEGVIDAYCNDPLIDQRSPSMALVKELRRKCIAMSRAAPQFSVPFLLMHGTADKICRFDASHQFFERSTVEDKKFLAVEGGFHELLNEPDHLEVAFPAATEWLAAHL